MTLLPTGQIGLSQVNTELGRTSTLQIDLGGTNPATTIRTLAGVASGQIGMNSLRGKSNYTLNTSSRGISGCGELSSWGSGRCPTLKLNSSVVENISGYQTTITLYDGINNGFPIYDTDSKSATYGQVIAYSMYYARNFGKGTTNVDLMTIYPFSGVSWNLATLVLSCGTSSGGITVTASA